MVTMCRADVAVVQVWLWHGAGRRNQAGFSLWSVPLVPAISVLTSCLCLVASLCNKYTTMLDTMKGEDTLHCAQVSGVQVRGCHELLQTLNQKGSVFG
jgi:hypothetical protein